MLIFVIFSHHFAITPKDERRAELRDQYYFECQCLACLENFPIYYQLPILKEYPGSIISQKAYMRLRNQSKDFAHKMLNLYLTQLGSIYKLCPYPNKQACDLQEAVKHCLAILTKET